MSTPSTDSNSLARAADEFQDVGHVLNASVVEGGRVAAVRSHPCVGQRVLACEAAPVFAEPRELLRIDTHGARIGRRNRNGPTREHV